MNSVVQDLLNMIENVSPDDTAKLDEIDARVWCWLSDYRFAGTRHDRVFVLDENQCEIEKLNGVCTLKYTRSRDALKAIRPEGWCFIGGMVGKYADMTATKLLPETPEFTAHQYDLPTEELAELHVIIQVIEYERGEL